jgi:hypothetical protein
MAAGADRLRTVFGTRLRWLFAIRSGLQCLGGNVILSPIFCRITFFTPRQPAYNVTFGACALGYNATDITRSPQLQISAFALLCFCCCSAAHQLLQFFGVTRTLHRDL